MPFRAGLQRFMGGVSRATQAIAQTQLNSVESRGGWWPIVRESFMGAWQQNVEITLANVLTFSTVFRCIEIVSSDVAKMHLRLVQQSDEGIWTETQSAAFSPVLREPNHYQTRVEFIEQWMISKLVHGNTYVLKQRDHRGVVVAMYVLDPQRVKPLVAPDSSVFYELQRDDLSKQEEDQLILPASEIMHDKWIPLYHPLVGLSPISACGLSAVQGLKIQTNSANLFANGANPGGFLSAPGHISQETADRLKAYIDGNFIGANVGKVLVGGDGLEYKQMSMSAVDVQLIEQLKWTSEDVCRAFGVPAYMVGVGTYPPYNNTEAVNTSYYSQRIQILVEKLEALLDKGLGLVGKIDGKQFGTELDIDDLIRMDTPTRVKSAREALLSGVAVNEVRKKFHDLGSVTGGDAVMLQQQMFSIEALAERDRNKPFAKPAKVSATSADTPEAMNLLLASGLSDDEIEREVTRQLREAVAA